MQSQIIVLNVIIIEAKGIIIKTNCVFIETKEEIIPSKK